MRDGPVERQEGAGRYEIRVRSHLSGRWDDWFDGFDLTSSSDGTTLLNGYVIDQAALYGVLRKLSDLGLPLVSVTAVDRVLEHPSNPTPPRSKS